MPDDDDQPTAEEVRAAYLWAVQEKARQELLAKLQREVEEEERRRRAADGS